MSWYTVARVESFTDPGPLLVRLPRSCGGGSSSTQTAQTGAIGDGDISTAFSSNTSSKYIAAAANVTSTLSNWETLRLETPMKCAAHLTKPPTHGKAVSPRCASPYHCSISKDARLRRSNTTFYQNVQPPMRSPQAHIPSTTHHTLLLTTRQTHPAASTSHVCG